MKLYELTEQYQKALDFFSEAEEIDEQTIKDTLESIDGVFEDKVVDTGKVVKTLVAEIEVIKAEEKRLNSKRKSLEKRIANIKQYLENQMIAVDKKKIKTPIMTVSIQKNPASVNILDETKIADEYLIAQDPKVDRKSILKDLKAGKEFEWAEIKQTESLRIR